MKMNIKTLTIVFAAFFAGLAGCKEEEYTLGDLTPPTALTITTEIVGKTVDLPNGDGSGLVNFTFSATNAFSYKVDFGDGQDEEIMSGSVTRKFNNTVGTETYRVVATAIGKGGLTSTAIEEINVYYAYEVNPETVTKLTGDSPTGKTWRINKDIAGHVGNGPGPDRPDGLVETFTPDWWTATPNAWATKGIYDDRYTFTSTKEFTHTANDTLFGFKASFAADFDPSTPGVYGGYSDQWLLTPVDDYTESFDYDGDDTYEYITFSQKGHCGLFIGAHRHMILELTDTTMWLRCTLPGTNTAAQYVKLIATD